MFHSDNNITFAKYGITKDINYQVALLPWGATEPHGYHIPYGTDCLVTTAISCVMADEAAKQGVNALVLPAVPYGQQNPGQAELTGCINASLATITAIMTDHVESLLRQGITKLIIMNGHGGNTFAHKAIIRDFAIRYPQMTIVACDYFTICKDKRQFFGQEIDDHAGEEETSLMLYFYPETVRMDLCGPGTLHPFALESLRNKYGWLPRIWNKASDDTSVGYAGNASAEKAKNYLDFLMPKLTQLLVEVATKDLY